ARTTSCCAPEDGMRSCLSYRQPAIDDDRTDSLVIERTLWTRTRKTPVNSIDFIAAGLYLCAVDRRPSRRSHSPVAMLNLMACEDFRAGDLGYVTDRGVCRVPQSGLPPDTDVLVKAVRKVKANTRGEFEELERLPDVVEHKK